MKFRTEEYLDQLEAWPAGGRHILAQYDNETVVVYQAYRPAISRFAVSHGYFGGEWSLSRMTWIRPGFLWMMNRSRWARETGQEVVLAVYLERSAFDELLTQAVHSTFVPSACADDEAWRAAIGSSDVHLQWDPDHDPVGAPQQRRTIQLGLRGSAATCFRREWIVHIENVTPFVHEQRERASPSRYRQLIVPRERRYPVTDIAVATGLGLDVPPTRSHQ
ncbi:MAG: DUF4291 domain-containing protein [Deltaproteobacteria bacterium]|nr:MAG: DUF4291 domain-containing protein [Deltaproteobacteria bacterium]